MVTTALSSLACASALVVAAGLAVAAGPDRPPTMPEHDATVTYQVTPSDHAPQVIRVYFSDGGRKMRIDGPGGQGDTILDRPTGLLTVVMNGQRAFMEVPARGIAHDPFLLSDDMDYTRSGTTEVIAGVSCNDWRMTSRTGASVACVTPDGLLLSANGTDGAGGKGRIIALAVSEAPVGPDMFAAPAGYTRIAHPATR